MAVDAVTRRSEVLAPHQHQRSAGKVTIACSWRDTALGARLKTKTPARFPDGGFYLLMPGTCAARIRTLPASYSGLESTPLS